MKKQLKISATEAHRVFKLLEEVNDLFHQPMKYTDKQIVENFAHENYKEIKELYYDVVWNWFPEEIKSEILNK